MAINWYRRHWFLFALFHIELVLLLWSSAVLAADLKDIRIGRYDDFTRIVFEFDVQTGMDAIERIAPGQYKITFAQTHARFTRAVPLKYSHQLKSFQVWQYRDRLSVILNFRHNHLRFDDFQFQNPPRLILDVFDTPLPADPPAVRATDLKAQVKHDSGAAAPLTNTLESRQAPMPLDRLNLSRDQGPTNPTGVTKTQKGLQYYLLIALVILTIAILSLLVVMLFSKRRWNANRRNLSIEDVLHRQDEHLASINSQIEEYLKRFNEE